MKTSPLVRSKILGLLGNTFTADGMDSRHRWEKLRQHVQSLLSQKRRTFFAIFIAFLESKQNSSHFEKKKISFIAYIFRKILTSTNVANSMPVSSCFRTPLAIKRGHVSQTLLEPALQQFYLNFRLI